MLLLEYTVAVLLSLTPFYQDRESFEEREARMQTLASAMVDSADRATCSGQYEIEQCVQVWFGSKKQLVLLLATKGNFESRFAKHIHEGNCGPRECDATRWRDPRTGKFVVFHRSKSVWQVQSSRRVPREEWNQIEGTDFDSTQKAAWAATKVLSLAMNKCKTVRGAFALYGTGRSCTLKSADKRARFYEQLEKKSMGELQAAADRQKAALEKRLSS
jgi:hypothetical protein